MKILMILLFATIIASCNTATTKPKANAQSSLTTSDTSTIDKSKFDPKWVDEITEMANTDDWVILKNDEYFTLIQVLTSRTNRHYILYSKDAEFDINGLAWMKIKAPSCLDIHTYNCDVDKLNFSIRDSYSTNFAFEKLHSFLYDELLKSPKLVQEKAVAVTQAMTARDTAQLLYENTLQRLDALTSENSNLKNEVTDNNSQINKLKNGINSILSKKNASDAEVRRAKALTVQLNQTIANLEAENTRLSEQ